MSSKLTGRRMAAMLRLVRDGNYKRHAADAVGIHFATVYNWLNKGDELLAAERVKNADIDQTVAEWIMEFPDNFDDDNPMWAAAPPEPFFAPDWNFILFTVGMKKAEAQAISDSVSAIKKAGKDDWHAHAWYLERTNYEHFGRKSGIQHSGPEGGAIPVGLDVEVGVENLAAKLEELRAARQLAKGGQ